LNASDLRVMPRIDNPVDPTLLKELLNKFPDFRRAYMEDALSADTFDTYGPTVRTLLQFLEAVHALAAYVQDLMLPSPDKKSA
jgi:transaldolase